MRFLTLLSLLCLLPVCENARAAEAADKPAPAAPKGPLVEITAVDESSTVTGYLLSIDGSKVRIEREDGQTREEPASNVKSIRFVPPPPGKEAAEPVVERPLVDPANTDAPLSQAERSRLRHLIDKDEAGTLKPAEVDEYRKLRERAMKLPGDGPLNRLRRLELASTAARSEKKAQRLDQYISYLQERVVHEKDEDDVRNLLIMLQTAYLTKGMVAAKIRESLQKDIERITDPELRRRVGQKAHDLMEPRLRRP